MHASLLPYSKSKAALVGLVKTADTQIRALSSTGKKPQTIGYQPLNRVKLSLPGQ